MLAPEMPFVVNLGNKIALANLQQHVANRQQITVSVLAHPHATATATSVRLRVFARILTQPPTTS